MSDLFTRVSCTRTKTCNANVFIIDGNAYIYNGKSLKRHDCAAYAESRKSKFPNTVYVGAWVNRNTGHIRYTGPAKTEKIACTEPDSYHTWDFLCLYVSTPEWETAKNVKSVWRKTNYGRATEEPRNETDS